MSELVISQNHNDYFPLAVGNYWVYYNCETLTYKYYDSSFVMVLGKEKKENNKEYFAVSEWTSKFSDVPNRYYRIDDSSRVYSYCDETKKEYLLEKLEAKIGETWISNRFEGCNDYNKRHARMTEIDTAKQTILINYNLYNPNPPGPEFNSINVYFKKGMGIYYFETDDHIARGLKRFFIATNGVEKGHIPEPSLSYILSNNYPNPFNPSTKISYSLDKSGFVTLKIYDILGREIKTLVSEYRKQGNYEVTFDASTAAGGLSSGVYVYRLQVNDFVESKKMFLLK